MVVLCHAKLKLASHFLTLSFSFSIIHLYTNFPFGFLPNPSTNCNPFHWRVTIMCVAHLLCINLVLVSKNDLETSHPHVGFLWFLSVTHGKWWGSNSNQAMTTYVYFLFLWCSNPSQAQFASRFIDCLQLDTVLVGLL